MNTPCYFIRDDDIGELTPALRDFVELFIARGIPVSYQIIPEQLTAECARYLLDVERAHPDLIEFGQHGLRHWMMLKGKRLKREFGPERTFEQQADDIAQGKQALLALLGNDREITLFTPPQHKFDRQTILAAAAAGHRVFSAASYPSPHHKLAYTVGRSLGMSSIRHHGISYHGRVRPEAPLREVSISIAVDNGRRITCPASELDRAMARASANTAVVGLMFHHAVYAEAKADLEAIVSRLATYPGERFRRLGDLAA